MGQNQPLLDTLADRGRFAASSASSAFAEAVRRRRNALLVGEDGAGKTTVLRMTQLELREAGLPVVYCSLRPAPDTGTALTLVRAALSPDDAGPTRPAGDEPLALVQAVRDLAAAVGDDSTVLLDDVPAAVGRVLFGRLRDELWQAGIAWGVATTPAEATPLLAPPADAFFDRRCTLEPLDAEGRRALLRIRAPQLPAGDVEVLAGTEIATPRRLLEEVDAAESGADLRTRWLARDVARAQVRRRFGDAAGDLLDQLDSLGPVSAGDARLLDALGWSRPRAATLLRQLEDGGLLTSHVGRDGGPGRPKKLYALAEPR